MVQPKYDDVSDNPIYSVDSDKPAYLCKEIEFDCLDCGTNDMQVVLSGFDPADCNCHNDTVDTSWEITSATLNGTHTLASVGNCVWFLGLSSVVTFSYYNSLDCSGTGTPGSATGASITLSYVFGGWNLEIVESAFTYKIFDGGTASEECPSGLVIDNTGGADCPSSGTATVTQL